MDYIFDQSPERLFRHLMPRYVTTQIFHAMLESVAAEHAARMTAMDAATKNAGDMIDALSLTMNRVRQAAITKEIIEIVSGAACRQSALVGKASALATIRALARVDSTMARRTYGREHWKSNFDQRPGR